MLTSHLPQSRSFMYLSEITDILSKDHLIDHYGFADFVIRRQKRATLGVIWSVRLLALRRRQRSAARNLGTKRVTFIAPEQVRQLLRHAISHLAVDWLDGFAISTVENFLARRNTRLFALRMLGEAKAPATHQARIGARAP